MRKIILFGYGKNGKAVANYLDKKSFLLVVFNEEEKEEVIHDGYLDIEVYDDKILDEDLISIGIKEADIAICMLEDEARNMFLALSIRNLNPKIKIIAKVEDNEYIHRYTLAGVNQLINPYEITANRIDSILNKPVTLEFIHNIVFGDNQLSFAQIEIESNSFLDGKNIKDVNLNELYNIIVIGIVDRERSDKLQLITDNKLDGGDVLVVIGDIDEIERLKNDIKGEK